MNLNLMQTGQSLKTRLSLYLALTLTNKKIQNFFSKNQIRNYACSARERTVCYVNICLRKGGVKIPLDLWTPCIYK